MVTWNSTPPGTADLEGHPSPEHRSTRSRLVRSLRRALGVGDARQAISEALSLDALGDVRPFHGVFELLARDVAERSTWGADPCLALVADMASAARRGDLDAAVAVSVAITAICEAHANRGARPVAMMAIDDELDATRAQRDLLGACMAEAEARVRRYARERGADAVVRDVMLPAIDAHLVELGDAALLVARAWSLARDFPDVTEDVMATAATMLAVTFGCLRGGGGLAPVSVTVPSVPSGVELQLDLDGHDALVGALLGADDDAVVLARGLCLRGVSSAALLRCVGEAVATRVCALAGAAPVGDDALTLARVLRNVHAAQCLLPLADRLTAARLALQCVGAAARLRGPVTVPPVGTDGSAPQLEAAFAARDLPGARAAAHATGDTAGAFRRLAAFAATGAVARAAQIAATAQNVEALRQLADIDAARAALYLDAALTLVVPWRPERDLVGLVRELRGALGLTPPAR